MIEAPSTKAKRIQKKVSKPTKKTFKSSHLKPPPSKKPVTYKKEKPIKAPITYQMWKTKT